LKLGALPQGRFRLKSKPFYRDRKFMFWLASLSPWDELARMAMRDDIGDLGASRKWEARISELEWDLIHTTDDIVGLLADIGRTRARSRRW
jgi:hypothetical protein